MEIKIGTGEELRVLLEALAREIVDANIYHRLYCDLLDQIPEYEREFNQSNTFWGLTIDAIRDARMTHLCRVYDQESNSLNMVNLLHTIKANRHFFLEVHFRDRIIGNAFVDSLAQVDRMPDLAELEADIISSTCTNPAVKKLMIWRNNIIAHLGAKQALGKTSVVADNPLEQEEIEALLGDGFRIFNKYSSLYLASSWSRQIVGHDDYKSVFNFIRLGLEKYEENIQKEVEELKRKMAEPGVVADRSRLHFCPFVTEWVKRWMQRRAGKRAGS